MRLPAASIRSAIIEAIADGDVDYFYQMYRDRDRWRHACLAACRRLADAEFTMGPKSGICHERPRELGTDGYSIDKCTTHHGTRPPR